MARIRTYQSPAHDRVRAHLADLITCGIPFARRGAMRGFFMPGPEALELPHLAAVGIAGQQLTGVEWLSMHASYIREKGYPFMLHASSLEDYVLRHASDAPFDFILLDFDGGFYRFANDIVGCYRLLAAPSTHCATFSTTYHFSRDQLPLVRAASLGYGMLSQLIGKEEALRAHDVIVAELRRIPVGESDIERMHRALRELSLFTLYVEGLVRSASTSGAAACAAAWNDAVVAMWRALKDQPLRAYHQRLPFPPIPEVPAFHAAVARCALPRWPEAWFRCAFTSPPSVRMQTLAMQVQRASAESLARPLGEVVRAALRDFLMTPLHIFDLQGHLPIPVTCALCAAQIAA